LEVQLMNLKNVLFVYDKVFTAYCCLSSGPIDDYILVRDKLIIYQVTKCCLAAT